MVSSFTDFLRHIEDAAITTSKVSQGSHLALIQHTAFWAEITYTICSQVKISRNIPLSAIQRLLDAFLTLLLFNAGYYSQMHAMLLSEQTTERMRHCLITAFTMCSMLCRYPGVICNLDTPLLAWAPASNSSPSSLVLSTRRSVLVQYAQTTQSSDKFPYHDTLVYLFLAVDVPFPGQMTPVEVSAACLSDARSRFKAAGYKFSRSIRAAIVEVCLGCGSNQKVAGDAPREYKVCGACGISS